MTVSAQATGQGELTDDAFLGGRLRILQPRAGYRAGLDAVLLAAAAPLGNGPCRVLDAGAGVGTAGLCAAARHDCASVVLLERDEWPAELARQNARRNGLEARSRVVVADVSARAAALAAAGIGADSFDHVIANPPYHARGAGTRSSVHLKDQAHAMEPGDIEGWVRLMARVAAPGGSATIVHKAGALAVLLRCLDGRFGGIVVLPVHPREGEPASRVVVQGRKGSRAPPVLLRGLVLHGEGSAFTPAAEAILRHGAALAMSG